MSVFGVWHPGNGHGAPDLERDVERFDTIDDAHRALLDRYQDQFSRHHIRYANRRCEDVSTPEVGEDTFMDVYLALDNDDKGDIFVHDNGPDFRLTIYQDAVVVQHG